MEPDLIIKVLKSACGNKNFRFQVIVQDSKLHIYINRKPDYHPNYLVLTDTIADAIASLGWEDLQGIWLYSRKLGETDPDWQTFIKPPEIVSEDEMITAGSAITEATSTAYDPEGFELETDIDSFEDTGLLENTGLIHTKPLEAEELNISVIYSDRIQDLESDLKNPFTSKAANITPESTAESEPELEIKPLSEYCFVPNKKILTGSILIPEKEIIRLIKCFHHLSDNNRQKILPYLAEFFTKFKIPEIENLALAVKKWLKQIADLKPEDRKLVAIWLSRYCFAPEATMAEFKQMEVKKAQKAKAKTVRKKRTNTEYSFTPATPIVTPTFSNNDSVEDLDLVIATKKWEFPPVLLKILRKISIPAVWILATLVAIFLGIDTNHFQNPQTSQQILEICQTSIGSANYCRLGVNLAGANTIQELSTNIFPLSDITESVADYGCQRFANVKAEAFSNLDPQQNPVISSRGEKIFPHIYVTQAVQQHATKSERVRVACVYATGAGERSPKKLASEVIPLNWPAESYQPATITRANLSFGNFTNLVNLGLYTIFATCGLAIASSFNLGLKITNRPQTIYLVALVLGIVQAIAVGLPMLNLIASIILPMVAILVISKFSRHLQIDWDYGYPLIVSGILIAIAVQLLFYGLSLKLIQLFVGQ